MLCCWCHDSVRIEFLCQLELHTLCYRANLLLKWQLINFGEISSVFFSVKTIEIFVWTEFLNFDFNQRWTHFNQFTRQCMCMCMVVRVLLFVNFYCGSPFIGTILFIEFRCVVFHCFLPEFRQAIEMFHSGDGNANDDDADTVDFFSFSEISFLFLFLVSSFFRLFLLPVLKFVNESNCIEYVVSYCRDSLIACLSISFFGGCLTIYCWWLLLIKRFPRHDTLFYSERFALEFTVRCNSSIHIHLLFLSNTHDGILSDSKLKCIFETKTPSNGFKDFQAIHALNNNIKYNVKSKLLFYINTL